MKRLSWYLVFGVGLGACAASPDAGEEVAGLTAGAQDHAFASTVAPDRCAELASELAKLLAAAQSCNVAAANAWQCATWVPAVTGCVEPVAAAGSPATQAYLKAFDEYASSCYLPDIACIDPSTLTVGCTQDADIDGLEGRCSILE